MGVMTGMFLGFGLVQGLSLSRTYWAGLRDHLLLQSRQGRSRGGEYR